MPTVLPPGQLLENNVNAVLDAELFSGRDTGLATTDGFGTFIWKLDGSYAGQQVAALPDVTILTSGADLKNAFLTDSTQINGLTIYQHYQNIDRKTGQVVSEGFVPLGSGSLEKDTVLASQYSNLLSVDSNFIKFIVPSLRVSEPANSTDPFDLTKTVYGDSYYLAVTASDGVIDDLWPQAPVPNQGRFLVVSGQVGGQRNEAWGGWIEQVPLFGGTDPNTPDDPTTPGEETPDDITVDLPDGWDLDTNQPSSTPGEPEIIGVTPDYDFDPATGLPSDPSGETDGPSFFGTIKERINDTVREIITERIERFLKKRGMTEEQIDRYETILDNSEDLNNTRRDSISRISDDLNKTINSNDPAAQKRLEQTLEREQKINEDHLRRHLERDIPDDWAPSWRSPKLKEKLKEIAIDWIVKEFVNPSDSNNPGSKVAATVAPIDTVAFSVGSDDLATSSATRMVVAGSGVSDKLEGGVGQDDLYGGRGNDQLNGKAGKDYLFGGSGKDTVRGDQGDDVIRGGLEADQLHGNSGRDSFVFDTRSAGGNVDTIKDYIARDDSIWLDNAFFKALGSSGTEGSLAKLDRDYFYAGKKAHDDDDHIIYDKRTGSLFYDSDGLGGAGQVKIAVLSNKTALSSAEFFVM